MLEHARRLPPMAARELVATLRSAFWPLARLHRMPKPGVAGHPAVVLVHGYLGHPDMFRPLMRRLYRAGYRDIGRVGYASTQLELHEICGEIDAVVRAMARQRGPVLLVGHSLGAVASRAYLKSFGGAEHVRAFVSLGGPHAGTSMFRFAPPNLWPVLDPRGEWVERLNDGVEPVPTTVIRSAYDHQVFPPVRASIDGIREIVLTGHGHNGLLWASDVHDAVLHVLDHYLVDGTTSP